MDFQEVMMFLQALPTRDWTEKDIELLLSEAFIWQSLFKGSSSHLKGGSSTTPSNALSWTTHETWVTTKWTWNDVLCHIKSEIMDKESMAALSPMVSQGSWHRPWKLDVRLMHIAPPELKALASNRCPLLVQSGMYSLRPSLEEDINFGVVDRNRR